MDNNTLHYRIDEFTESVEQLWQSEEQQSGQSSNSAESSGSESERGASAP